MTMTMTTTLHHTTGEHERYGLSPINVDRVDLRRFDKLTKSSPYVVDLYPGDALYVPSLWWHVVMTPPGRNILLTTEFEYHQQVAESLQLVHLLACIDTV